MARKTYSPNILQSYLTTQIFALLVSQYASYSADIESHLAEILRSFEYYKATPINFLKD